MSVLPAARPAADEVGSALPSSVPWWRVGLGDAVFDGRRLLLVVVALLAVQAGLRVALAAPGTFSSRPAAWLAVALLVVVPGALVLASGRTRAASSGLAVVATASAVLGADVLVLALTAGSQVYGEGLFTVTGGGLAVLALAAVRPLGVVVGVGALHTLLVLAGSFVHSPQVPVLSLARGLEVALAAAAPVVASAAYLLLVAQLTQARRLARKQAEAEEVERRATAAEEVERVARLAAARREVGPLLERVVAGAALPLGAADAERAAAASRRLRAHLLRRTSRTWLDEALADDPVDAVPAGAPGARLPAPPAVVRAVAGPVEGAPAGAAAPDGLGAGRREALLALVRLCRAHGGEVTVTLLPGSAVLAVRDAGPLLQDPLAEQLVLDLAAAGWIREGDGVSVLEVVGDLAEAPDATARTP
ncbi:hypothetical protein [Pseudokineococcus sp. 1T1Z-3]|uniref:hypothetical protein n=1 Tax=Pseudokineococcus sp. 1T1Z-3 TaxID=3132745 RepID=UPI0030B6ED7B